MISTLIASTNNFGGFNQIRASWAEVTPVNLNGIAFYIRVIVNNNDNLSFDLTNTGNTEISDPLGNPYTNVTYSGTNTSVTASTTNTTNATACSTYTWSVNNQSYSASGTYTIRFGCHLEILNLTISAQPPAPTGLSCYETATFNTTSCSWDISGTQPPAPTGLACYETATFNTTSCSWDISGTQPAAPTGLACYETASFNTTSCSWEVSGTQPPAPTGLACYETATFNTTSCSWVVSGTQPTAPTGLACYETATFNTTSCSWVISGTPSPTIVTNISACNSFLWPINGLTYSSGGVYNFSQNCQDYRLILTINPSYNINVTLPLFFGSTFNFNGQTITSAGTYSSTFQSIYGCDSVVNLTLVSSTTEISVGNASVSCPGDVVTVPILISGVSNLAAISLALNYNTQALSYVSYSGLNPAIANNFLINNVNGQVRVAWFDLTPANFSAQTVLFNLVFNVQGNSP
ncbi:MAG: cohesin domain-containing protein, partial [Bacteroidota bacterium]